MNPGQKEGHYKSEVRRMKLQVVGKIFLALVVIGFGCFAAYENLTGKDEEQIEEEEQEGQEFEEQGYR